MKSLDPTIKKIALFLLITLSAVSSASAADVTIAWDANTEPDLAGYILFYGTSSGSYTESIDAGNATEYTLTGLAEGTTYYFAAKAYNSSDNQSDYSQELVYTVPSANTAPNTPATPSGAASGFVQTNYAYNTSGTDPDGDLLTYRFDWGDGNISPWGGAYSRTHAFSSEGTYCVKAQSQDPQGAASAWSACLNVSMAIQQYTITASAGANGSISPSGPVQVDSNGDQSFSISPNQNYHIADVVVDGASVGSVTGYTFSNVDRSHTIAATFAMDNQPPVSNAGADQAVRVSDTVQLDGSNSSDADGDGLTYNWSLISRPSGSSAVLSVTQTVKPTFTADAAGTYSVRLIVNDGTVNSAPDTVVVTTLNSAPVSNAGADLAALVNDTVQLDGSQSSDPDGDSLTYQWTFVSRPTGSNAALSSANTVKPTFAVDVAGSYTVRLIVNDGTVNSSPDTITVSTLNSAPVGNAGADQTVLVHDTVQLDGSGSSDLDGDSLTFTWSLVSRPAGSQAVLSDGNAMQPTLNIDLAGSYTVRLIVNDGTADSAPDAVTISTENSAPVAEAGADQAVLVNDAVQLDGSGSSDVDGDSLSFSWSFVSRPAGSSAALSNAGIQAPAFTVDVAGTYTVQLIVNDGTANSAPDTVTISTENSAPEADAGADQAVPVDGTVKLDGSSSRDADGDTLNYRWSFVSRPAGSSAFLSGSTSATPTFSADAAGTYAVQLIVNDGTADSAPDTVTISTENSAPVADAGADRAVPANETVQLDGSGSGDVDGDLLSYRWSFVSRPAGSSASLSGSASAAPAFVPDAVGTYTVQLIVNDGTVDSAPDTVRISTRNSAPISNAGGDQTVEAGSTVLLSGSGSTDAEQNIVDYQWEQTGGTAVTLASSDRSETSVAVPQGLAVGEQLIFTLTVTDAGGLSDADTCVIEIKGPAMVDSDGDGIADDQDAFPYDATEILDTDGDGIGNNADGDDDNDGMPDAWELSYGLDPLQDDSAGDPDGDGVSNINEYNLGSQPNFYEGNIQPDAPVLLAPEANATTDLTPQLRTGEFSDANVNDVHQKTHWKVTRAFDGLCVFDVTSAAALTSMTLPKQVLEANTEYIWKARFIDSRDTASEWSAEREFTTADVQDDLNENGVPDNQEISEYQDIDLDGTADLAQTDIRCVNVAEKSGSVQICVSIRNAANAYSIESLEAEDAADPQLVAGNPGKPNFIEFGLLDFKVLVDNPGDETTVTIYLSKPSFKKGNCFKYDPVNEVWLDYSGYTEFSANRKEVYLTIQDGGFGDADGLPNGIIVDPLAFGSETDPNGGSDSPLDQLLGGIIPGDLSCFISAAAGARPAARPASTGRPTRMHALAAMLLLSALLVLVVRFWLRRRKAAGSPEDSGKTRLDPWPLI